MASDGEEGDQERPLAAMMAFLGGMVQAAVTGEGPSEEHERSHRRPLRSNMLANFSNVGGAASF